MKNSTISYDNTIIDYGISVEKFNIKYNTSFVFYIPIIILSTYTNVYILIQL